MRHSEVGLMKHGEVGGFDTCTCPGEHLLPLNSSTFQRNRDRAGKATASDSLGTRPLQALNRTIPRAQCLARARARSLNS